jgi:hypothetical protein
MKVQAQDLKVGMVIKVGNWKGAVTSEPTQSTYRKSDIDVVIDVIPSIIKRRGGDLPSKVAGGNSTVSLRKTTMVQIH